MGQILVGSNEIKQILLGNTQIKEVWLGNTKIYPTTTGTTAGANGYVLGISPATISKTTSNPGGGSTTNTTFVKFLANGSMDFGGATVSPSWTQWNTAVGSLVNPKLKFLAGGGLTSVEISTNSGSTWSAITAGTEYAMTSGVWLRIVHTGTVSGSTTAPNVQITYVNNAVDVDTISLNITSAISVASNPFVTSFGTVAAEDNTVWSEFAEAVVYVYGRSVAVNGGKLVASSRPTNGDPMDYNYYNWVLAGQTAPAGTYTVVLSGFALVSNGTYSLPDNGSQMFVVSAKGTSSSSGQTRTDSGTIAIQKDGVTVSSGTLTFFARSQGVIV